MVITVQEILRDCISSFPGGGTDWDKYSLTNWINESYVELRNEYVDANRHEQFAINNYFGEFTDMDSIPYLKRANLTYPILQRMSVQNAVVAVVCRVHDELVSIATAWSKGDKAWYGNDLFEAVTDIPEIDSTGLTFTRDKVRNYHPANGLKYFEGDVVFENGNAFRANTEYIATTDDALSTRAEWDQVYWKRIGIGFVDPVVTKYSAYDRKKSIVDSGGVVVAINKNEIYLTKNVTSMYIEYVPEHKWKRGFDEKFTLPDDMQDLWRTRVHKRMYASLGQMTESQDES